MNKQNHMKLTPVRLSEITEIILWKLLCRRFEELRKESENPFQSLVEMSAKEFGVNEEELRETINYLFVKYGSAVPA
jgi:hypothetical protein